MALSRARDDATRERPSARLRFLVSCPSDRASDCANRMLKRHPRRTLQFLATSFALVGIPRATRKIGVTRFVRAPANQSETFSAARVARSHAFRLRMTYRSIIIIAIKSAYWPVDPSSDISARSIARSISLSHGCRIAVSFRGEKIRDRTFDLRKEIVYTCILYVRDYICFAFT